MLSITPSGSSTSAKDYFANSLSKGDYYLKDDLDRGSNQEVEIVGHWHGNLAEKLGLQGNITQEQFNALADNVNPVTGEKLTARNTANRIAGYDFTFNAPKSLSILYEITQDERLLNVFRDSVAKTMSHVEEDMETRVRKNGLNENRTTSNMIWGEFIHTTSRPVDGKPDPHLHIHAYAFNATLDEQEQQIKAGKFRNIKRDGNYYEAYFHSELSNSLSDMGLNIERKGRFWEIADLERSTIEKFSNRTLKIEETANEYGITNNDTKAKLARFNRELKNEDLTKDQLRNEWESRLTEQEKATIHGAFNNDDNDDPRGQVPSPTSVSIEQAKEHAVSHVFERCAVVPMRKLQEQALRFSFGDLTPAELENSFNSEELIKRELHGKTHVTTEQVLREEKAMVDYVRTGFNTEFRLNNNYQIRPQINQETGDTWHFEGEAKKAIEHILQSRDSVIALQGYAGTGKTTLMAETINGIEQPVGDDSSRDGNKQVFTFAPSSDAVDVLKKEGFDNSHTVARLLLDETLQSSLQDQVIWIDEAGLLSTPQMKAVFDIAKEQNARVILGGDTGQHHAVERGDAFHILQTEARLEPATISDIKRQKPKDYKQAVTYLAKGKVKNAFEIFDKNGSIKELDTDQRYKTLANEYVETMESGLSALVVSPTHVEGQLVTNEIRDILKASGKLSEAEKEYTTYKNLNYTKSQRQDAFQYEQGNIIRFTTSGSVQNASGIKKGEIFTVTGRNHQNDVLVEDKNGYQSLLNLDDASRFNVYQAQTIGLSKGDIIRVTENSVATSGNAENKHKLANGSLYQIDGFTREGDIRTKEGHVIDKDRGNLAHGYVATSHASQGKTVDKVFIAQSSDSFNASSIEQFYVSASRGREEITIYTDDKQNLLEAVSESNKRLSATDLAKRRKFEEDAYIQSHIINNVQNWGNNAMDYAMDKIHDFSELMKDSFRPAFLALPESDIQLPVNELTHENNGSSFADREIQRKNNPDRGLEI